MTQHADFASTAATAATAHDPWAGTMARNTAASAIPAPADNSATPPSTGRRWEDVRREDNDRGLARIEARVPDTPITPASLALHARQVALPGAATSFSSVPGLPEVMRPAGPVPDVDRTLHPSFPASVVEVVEPSAPLPGTVPATTYDPWRPLQIGPTPVPDVPPRTPAAGEGHGTLDAELTAAQFAAVAASRAKLDRARSYAARLGAHAADLRAKLSAASERRAAAAIGKAEPDAADLGPIRGELVTVERQHGQALAVLAEVEAEHARHEADFAALTGSDGAARARLAEAHAARAVAQTATDDAKALLGRAEAHVRAVAAKLDAARADEADHDEGAAARLRIALADGSDLPAAAEPFARASGALEDDLRAARAAADALRADHAAKAAALAAADLKVKGAVDGVLCAEAEAMARELNAADARALALRVRLHCYTGRRAADWVAPPASPPKMMPGGWMQADPAAYATPPAIRTTNVIGAAIAAAPVPQTGGVLSNAWTAEHAGWNAYAAALAADPEASPDFGDGPTAPPASPLAPAFSSFPRFPASWEPQPAPAA